MDQGRKDTYHLFIIYFNLHIDMLYILYVLHILFNLLQILTLMQYFHRLLLKINNNISLLGRNFRISKNLIYICYVTSQEPCSSIILCQAIAISAKVNSSWDNQIEEWLCWILTKQKWMNKYIIGREDLKCADHLKNVIMQGKIFNIFNCTTYQSAFSPTYVLLDK